MNDLSIEIEDVPREWTGLGGRGLTSSMVAAEVNPECHALGPRNKLIFAPGLLSGTAAANAGRLSCGAKSPLTGTIKESNAGGTAAQMLARLGCKALVIEGKPAEDKWYGLHFTSHGIILTEETELVGHGNFRVVEEITNRLGKNHGVITIGPAGEMGMLAANISVKDPDGKLRSHGRGGLGAVMGSKRIKFIAIDPSGSKVKLADPDGFTEANRIFTKALVENPISQALKEYGTNILVNIVNNAGALPTRNFTAGQFDGHDKISGETMHDLIKERGGRLGHKCHPGCVIQCSQIFNDKNGKYLTSGFEYESIWAMGADCCIDNLDLIAQANHIMDDMGVDTIEISVAMGVAMEAGLLEFGDGPEALRILREEIARGTPLGRIIGCGAASTGRAFGVTRVPVVKNQAIPAYDPRAVKGIGITYATSTMGADHTAGYTIATNLLNSGGHVDPLSRQGQIELSRNLQIATAAIDSTGMCIFTAFAALDDEKCLPALVDMINARFGTELIMEDITGLGARILKLERDFNMRAGFGAAQDRLPEFFSHEPCPPHNAVWDFTGPEIDLFWDF